MIPLILEAVKQSGKRIATVKANQRTQGRCLGGTVPFGFTVGFDGTLQEVPDQQAAIATARTMRASGAVLRLIQGKLLEAHGVKLSLDAVARIAA